MTKVLPAAARQQLDARLDRLRAQSFEELKLLAPFCVEDVRFGDETWSLSTYRDLEPSALRIIVQVGPPQPKLVLLHVQADGFRIKPSGDISALSEKELHEFQ